ncbi:hypothetical protein PLICRDRAFT_126507 [Plicaturopsis crispa FD-325 SS-3]|uniref:TPR-like protein n=1 Tax=Plicaturopsis crispa FD-325 SS-3 TaxID=944288 RepID=A0A0C9SLA3_PLICR|nr:hypothetical protein PLICRDRAFT_126507 [Plicaturopsis crispa FD-325 SS-3]
MPTDAARAAKLKDEGNKLFAAKKYDLASKIYGQAIALNASDAALWANRAACALSLRRYDQAVDDSKKARIAAVQIDPGYSKAWARLGKAYQALELPRKCMEAWENALASIPTVNPTAAQIKLKVEYEPSLKEARLNWQSKFYQVENTVKMPWDIAQSMVPELLKNLGNKEARKSSAWVILTARGELLTALDAMRSLGETTIDESNIVLADSNHKAFIFGLECLTNAIIRDSRVCFMGGTNLFGLWQEQAEFELLASHGWNPFTTTPATVIEEVQKRQREQGWTAARLALSTSIRVSITKGFFEHEPFPMPNETAVYLHWALDVLEWGRKAWKDVPRADKGDMFEPFFIQAVKRLHLLALLDANERDDIHDDSLEKIGPASTDLLLDLEQNPLPNAEFEDQDIGFFATFALYPSAAGYFGQAVHYEALADSVPSTKKANRARAVELYLSAADLYPVDDVYHVLSLNRAQSILTKEGVAHLARNRELIAQQRARLPAMRKIWERSVAWHDLERFVVRSFEFDDQLAKQDAAAGFDPERFRKMGQMAAMGDINKLMDHFKSL